MLINLHDLVVKYGIKFNGILHVGAHECEEIVYYDKYIARDKVLWIDALPDKVEQCKKVHQNILIENAVVSDTVEKLMFHRSNNDQSSSIFNLGIHKFHHPQIYYTNEFEVETQMLSTILDKEKYSKIDFNFINLDIQGAELKALKGMEKYLKNIDYIYTEVNEDYVYVGCALVSELDVYLSKWNFVRKETQWCGNTKWGDAFYIKTQKQIQIPLESLSMNCNPTNPTNPNDIKISLCITTKDRYDNFLSKFLDSYVQFLNNGIIDEIVISDENGNDYQKIYNKYKDIIISANSKFILSKNDSVLGVFLNKLRVANLASYDLIALIDSDNFANKDYFINAKTFIKNIMAKANANIIISPSYAISQTRSSTIWNFSLNYKAFCNNIITKYNIKQFMDMSMFKAFLNTGNYILSKTIMKNIKYDVNILEKISSCDVIYFNMLALQQFDNLEIHIVNNMEYIHNVHNDSEYLKTHTKCDETLANFITPQYYKF